MNNQPYSHTIREDKRFQYLHGKVIPKPNIFNGKKVAEELLKERNALMSLAWDFQLFSALDIRSSLNDGYHRRNVLYEEINKLHQEVGELNTQINVESFGLYDFDHPAKDSVQLSQQLQSVRDFIKVSISSKQASVATTNFTFNNDRKQGQKFVNDMTKIMLRAYNAEAENAVKSVKSNKSEAAVKKLHRCRAQVEKLGTMIDFKILDDYHKARIQEIELAYAYHTIVQQEKEKAREEREKLREEKKAQAELQKRQENLHKELTQKQTALRMLQKSIENFEELPVVEQEKIETLVHDIEILDGSLKETEERSANMKAGYVYVISNIGSFGEGRVKIGMTRRIDPMERIKELGSASVPFGFDVHMIHYSNNAVEIERQLHEHFAHRRVNMINKRREHFYATPEEVRQVVLSMDGSIATFNNDVEAEEYRESNAIRKKMSSYQPVVPDNKQQNANNFSVSNGGHLPPIEENTVETSTHGRRRKI